MKIVGIDISHNQGVGSSHNIRDFYNDGAQFIIAKATQRHNYKDPGYASHAEQMSRIHDLIPGAYHWLTQHDGVDQARHFVSTVRKAWGGNVPAEHIWAIDIEKPQFQYGDDYCSWSNFLKFVQEFRRLVPESALWVYTRPDIWISYWRRKGKHGKQDGPHNPNGRELGLQLWNAYWVIKDVKLSAVNPNSSNITNRSYTPYGGWHTTPIQQVTSSGHSNGIRLDIDVFDGTAAQLRAICASGAGNGGGGKPCPIGYHRDSSGVCVPNTAGCPEGQHKDANGICVPNDDPNDPGTDEPWDNHEVQQQIVAAGITGIGAGSTATLILVGISIAILAAVYMAYKAGDSVESVKDSGEKD